MIEATRRWQKRNPEKVLEMRRKYNKKQRQRLWAIDGIQADLLLAERLNK